MGSAFNLGKLFGIQFRLHFTWFIIFILVTVSLVDPNYFQWLYWIIGIITSLLLFASVVAHELAHSLVGRANGIPIRSITLFIFGGVAQMTKEATRPGAELKMAAAGPLCSLVIGSLFGLIWLFMPNIPQPIAIMVLWLAVMNGVLAVFNLIPGFPLDGGRVFRSLLWRFTGSYRRSTRIATRVGQGIGCLFILGGISIIFLRPFGLSWFDGIWVVFIGWFLVSAASASYRQLRWQEVLHGFTASEATVLDCPAVPSKAKLGCNSDKIDNAPR
ncbi:site-2 protease family protein [Chloroflexota bacterium]